MQFIFSLSYSPSTEKKKNFRLLEKQWKSLSFDTDAVVLLPLFMKCLFCFFNEIFNVKVLFSSCYLASKGERENGEGGGEWKSRKHAKSNFALKQSLLSEKRTSQWIHSDNGMWSFSRFFFSENNFHAYRKSFFSFLFFCGK